jgi:F0F1-type ATP synthase membrane subunit c/vacuolar-type H+-ATPase subunit K
MFPALPPFKFVLPILGVFVLLRLVFWFNTFPNPDEAYYWLWGQHPALSYYDHPPLQAWIQGAFTALFGRSHVVLRLPNLISNLIFFSVYYQISRYIYGREAHQFFWLMVLLVLASPLYFLFLALAWHDHLLITCSLIALFLFIQFLDGYSSDGQGKSWQLYAAAIALGLAGLSKYNALFVALGMMSAIACNPQWRPLFRDRRLYLAGLMAAIFLLPILLWNLGNDFQSFRYYVNRSGDSGAGGLRLKWGEPLVFLLVSILTVSPFNVWAMIQAIKRPNPQPNSAYRTVALWIFAVSTVLLTAIAFVSTALYYWNITAYLLLFPLMPAVFLKAEGQRQRAEGDLSWVMGHGSLAKDKGQRIEDKEKSKIQNPKPKIFHKALFFSGQFYGLLFALLLVVHYSLFPLSAFGSPESDPDSRMLFGWDEVGKAVMAETAKSNQAPFFVTTDYRSASALAYQLNRPNVIVISDRIDQFDFWFDANVLQGRNAVILSDDWHPVEPKLIAQFERLSEPVTIPVTQFGRWIKNYYVEIGDRFIPEK